MGTKALSIFHCLLLLLSLHHAASESLDLEKVVKDLKLNNIKNEVLEAVIKGINQDVNVEQIKKEVLNGLKMLKDGMKGLDSSGLKGMVAKGLGDVKSILKGLELGEVQNGLKELNLGKIVEGLNLEKTLKDVGPELEKMVRGLNIKEMLRKADLEDVVKEMELGNLVKELDDLIQGFDIKDLIGGVENIVKGLDLVKLAQGLETIVKGLDFTSLMKVPVDIVSGMEVLMAGLDLDGLLKGAEEVVTGVEDLIKDLDLEKPLKSLKDLLTKLKDLNLEKLVKGIKLDLDAMFKDGVKELELMITEGIKQVSTMIKDLDLKVLKATITKGLADLMTSIKGFDIVKFVKDLDLEKLVKGLVSEAWQKVQNLVKELDTILKGLKIMDMIAQLGLDDIIKGSEVESMLKGLELEKMLKGLDLEEMLKSLELEKLLKGLDLPLKNLIKAMDKMIKGVDMGNLKKGLGWDNMVKTLDEMINGVDFDTLFKGAESLKAGAAYLVKGVDKVVAGLNFESLMEGIEKAMSASGLTFEDLMNMITGNKNKPCSSCVDCIRNGFCQHWAHDGEMFVKLMMSELLKHQKVSAEEMNQLPGGDVNSYYDRDDIGGNCMRNKIAYIAAYLFDLPAPSISKAEACQGDPKDKCTFDTCFMLHNTSINSFSLHTPGEGCGLFKAKRSVMSKFFKVMRNTLGLEASRKDVSSDTDLSVFNKVIQEETESSCGEQRVLPTRAVVKIMYKMIATNFRCTNQKLYEQPPRPICGDEMHTYNHNDEDEDEIPDFKKKESSYLDDYESLFRSKGPSGKPKKDDHEEDHDEGPKDGRYPPKDGQFPPKDGRFPPKDDVEISPPKKEEEEEDHHDEHHRRRRAEDEDHGDDHEKKEEKEDVDHEKKEEKEDGDHEKKEEKYDGDHEKKEGKYDGKKIGEDGENPPDFVLAQEDMRLIRSIDIIVKNYNMPQGGCMSEHDSERREKCGPFIDEYRVIKNILINKVQKNVAGCQQCQTTDSLNENSTCLVEDVQRDSIMNEVKTELMDRLYENVFRCSVFDDGCSEGTMRREPMKVIFTHQMMNEIIGCKNCNSPLTKNEIQVPKNVKYEMVGRLAEISEGCDDEPMFEEKEEEYEEDGEDEEDEEPEDEMDVENTLEEEQKDKHEENYRRYHNQRKVEKGRIVYSLLHKILQLEETENECEAPVKTQRMLVQGATTKDRFPGGNKECQELKVGQLEVDLFGAVIQKMTGCQKNAQRSVSSTRFCQTEMFHEDGTCVEDRNNTKASRNTQRVAMLLGYVFAGCGNEWSSPFQKAEVRCSYYAAINNGLKKDGSKIFGSTFELSRMYEAKKRNPELFTVDSADESAIKELFRSHKCGDRCPEDFSYCSSKKRCTAAWEYCPDYRPTWSNKMGRPVIPEMVKIIPKKLQGMKANESRSSPVSVGDFSKTDVVLVNTFTKKDTEYGVWQFNYEGEWRNITSVPSGMGVKLSSSSYIRYRLYRGRYGMRSIKYFEDETEGESGTTTAITKGVRLSVAYLMIEPTPPKCSVRPSTKATSYTLKEGGKRAIRVSDLFKVSCSVQKVDEPISPEDFAILPKNEHIKFMDKLRASQKERPFAKIKRNAKGSGKLWMKSNNQQRVIMDDRLELDDESASLVVEPSPDFSGEYSLELNFQMAGELPISRNILITVTPVNDPPTVGSNQRILVPAIAHNVTQTPNAGFTVQDLISAAKAKDEESGTDIGVAITGVHAPSKIGTWQYQTTEENNGTLVAVWKDLTLDVSNKDSVFLANKTGIVFRLKLANDDAFWDPRTGRTYISFRFWDRSDGLTAGQLHNITAKTMTESGSYSKPVFAFQYRLGCDNRPGSMAKIDKCGKCGGNGVCPLPCDGVKGSNATINTCGKCTLGATGRPLNYLVACKCRENYVVDDCDRCSPKNRKLTSSKDCNGVCAGKARTDTCGLCYGGNTGKLSLSTMDVCKVCDGDGSSCGNCDKKSGKDVDRCGQCLLPTSAEFNTGCFKLVSLNPSSASSIGGEIVELQGAGITDDVTCSLLLGNTAHALVNEKGKTSSTQLKMKTPALKVGTYSVQCKKGESKLSLTKKFRVYAGETITVSGVKPTTMNVNEEQELTFTGTNFEDTGEAECVAVLNGQVKTMKANVMNSTSVTCTTPSVSASTKATVAISFSKKSWSIAHVRKLKNFNLKIMAAAPKLLSAKMKDNYREIVLEFDSAAWSSQKSCATMFADATTKLFGKNYRCWFKGTKSLYIRLGSSATVASGSQISLLDNVIKSRYQKVVEYTKATTLSLVYPTSSFDVVAHISAPTIVGSCSKLSLSGRKSKGSGGRRFEYKWSVAATKGVGVAGNATLIANLEAKLAKSTTLSTVKLSPTDLPSGYSYNFTLIVKNFLGQQSPPVYHNVEKEATASIDVRVLGGTKQTIKASALSKLVSYARIPACMQKSGLVFAWSVDTHPDHPDLELDAKSSQTSRLYIKAGTFPGNDVYTLRVTVSTTDDFTGESSVVVPVEVTVISSPLIPRISGGRKRVVDASDALVLDASRSSDPDRTKETASYMWECSDEQERICVDKDENELVLPETEKVTIAGGKLKSGGKYVFKLFFVKGFRMEEQSTEVNVAEGKPPIVKTRVQRRKSENVDRRVTIRSVVLSHIENVRVWVECVAEDGFAYVDVTENNTLITPREVTIGRKGAVPFSVVFKENSLEGGFQYKFIIRAEHAQGAGYSEVVLSTNSPPTAGILESDVTTGTAVVTEFTLSAVEGWEDADVPLRYKFGYFLPTDSESGKRKRKFLGSAGSESSKSVTLPSGDASSSNELEVFVWVFDSFGSMTEQTLTLTVSPPEKVDTAVITSAMDAIEGAVESDDLDSALGAIASSLNTFKMNAPVYNASMGGEAIVEFEEVTEKLKEVKELMTNNVLTMMEDVVDESTQEDVIEALSDMTEGGTEFSEATKTKITTSVDSILRGQILTEGTRKRKRRNTEGGDEGAADGKTPEQVEAAMVPYGNTIEPAVMTEDAMKLKKTFTDLTPVLLQAMCQQLTFGQPAALASGALANLQGVMQVFANASETSIELNCGESSDCSSSSKLVLGASLADTYSSYTCGDADEKCTGACIGSTSYGYDLYNNDVSREVIGDVVSVVLVDPQDYKIMTPGTLAQKYEIHIPLKDEKYTANFYKCELWDESSSSWSADECTAEDSTMVVGSQSFVVCQCNKLGVVSVVSGEVRPPPTTTTAPTTTTPEVVVDEGKSTSKPDHDDHHDEDDGKSTKNLPLIIGIVVGALVALGAVYGGYKWKKKQQEHRQSVPAQCTDGDL